LSSRRQRIDDDARRLRIFSFFVTPPSTAPTTPSSSRRGHEALIFFPCVNTIRRERGLARASKLAATRGARERRREARSKGRDGVQSERDGVQSERDGVQSERDGVQSERDDVKSERDDAKSERDDVKSERDDVKSERDDVKSERDGVNSERDDAKSERDDVKSERADAKSERACSASRPVAPSAHQDWESRIEGTALRGAASRPFARFAERLPEAPARRGLPPGAPATSSVRARRDPERERRGAPETYRYAVSERGRADGDAASFARSRPTRRGERLVRVPSLTLRVSSRASRRRRGRSGRRRRALREASSGADGDRAKTVRETPSAVATRPRRGRGR
jgi:hypothetical protein